MATVSISWSCSLAIDTDNVQTVTMQGTAALNGCTHGHSLSWVGMLKIGVIYYDSANVALDMNGDPLGVGVLYSRYNSIKGVGMGGSPSTITWTETNHDGGAYCRTTPPPGAVAAQYRYYVAANATTACPGASFTDQLGSTSPKWGEVTL